MTQNHSIILHPSAAAIQRKADVMLLVATFFWGWTFPVVKDAISVMPVFAFLACRFALGAVCVMAISGLPSPAQYKQGVFSARCCFLPLPCKRSGWKSPARQTALLLPGSMWCG